MKLDRPFPRAPTRNRERMWEMNRKVHNVLVEVGGANNRETREPMGDVAEGAEMAVP